MPPAKPSQPRKRNRKRKRRVASSSSSSDSSDSDSSASDSPNVLKPKVSQSVNAPPPPSDDSDSESSSSDESSSSSSESDVAQEKGIQPTNDEDVVMENDSRPQPKRSHTRCSPSPPPPSADIPSFFPTGGNTEQNENKEKELKDKFRKFWMTTIVDAFQDDLEEIRKVRFPFMNANSERCFYD